MLSNHLHSLRDLNFFEAQQPRLIKASERRSPDPVCIILQIVKNYNFMYAIKRELKLNNKQRTLIAQHAGYSRMPTSLVEAGKEHPRQLWISFLKQLAKSFGSGCSWNERQI